MKIKKCFFRMGTEPAYAGSFSIVFKGGGQVDFESRCQSSGCAVG